MKLIFEWDSDKAYKNLNKHQVRFEEAKTIFNDPFLITFSDEYHSNAELRFISLGISSQGRVLLVVHTEQILPGDNLIIRIISCRKVTRSERKIYEEE
jgi:uncharacterized DUF497 family protein